MDRKIVLFPCVGLALVASNYANHCFVDLYTNDNQYLDLPHHPSVCTYAKALNPEHPEQSNGYNGQVASMDYVSASGTVASGTSLSMNFDR